MKKSIHIKILTYIITIIQSLTLPATTITSKMIEENTLAPVKQ